MDGTLIPEFDELNRVLVAHLNALATEIIASALAADTSAPDEVAALPS